MIKLNLIKRDKNYKMKSYHSHHDYEVFIVLTGECKFFIYDKLYTLKSGDAVLLKPDVFHYCSAVSEHSRINLEFSEEDLREFFHAALTDKLLSSFDAQLISLNSNELDKCTADFYENDELICLSAAEILRVLFKSYKSNKYMNTAVSMQRPEKMKQINSVVSYVSKHYKAISSLDEICSACYINKSYLCRLFKSTFAISVWEYIANLKIRNACELLTSTSLSVYDIALESGFNTSQYFSRIFKRHIGLTPVEYRRQKIG